VWPLLCRLVVVAMCSNLLAWAVCPHVSGTQRHCFQQQSAKHSPRNVEDAHAQHMHSDPMQMSDTDMQGMEGSSQFLSNNPVDSESSKLSRVNTLIAVLTGSRNSCSHCMMHAGADVNSSSQTVTVNSPSYENIRTDSRADIVKLVPLLVTVVEIHDHGPPGFDNSRYILNSTYRI
jgi:hypothetical protein